MKVAVPRFQPGNLVIIAARPSMGKSALVANIADFVAVEKKEPVAAGGHSHDDY